MLWQHINVSQDRIPLGCRSWKCLKEGSSGIDQRFWLHCSCRVTFNTSPMQSLIPGILTLIYVSHDRIWLGCRGWRCCKEGSPGIDSVYNAVVDLTLTLNFRHLRVCSLQRRIPLVAGNWGAKSVVTSTASPFRSSLLVLRRPRRLPMPSSPLPIYWRKNTGMHDLTYLWWIVHMVSIFVVQFYTF